MSSLNILNLEKGRFGHLKSCNAYVKVIATVIVRNFKLTIDSGSVQHHLVHIAKGIKSLVIGHHLVSVELQTWVNSVISSSVGGHSSSVFFRNVEDEVVIFFSSQGV